MARELLDRVETNRKVDSRRQGVLESCKLATLVAGVFLGLGVLSFLAFKISTTTV